MPHRIHRSLVAPFVVLMIALAVVATVGFPDRSSAAARPAFGVQFHAMWSDYSDAQRLQVLDRLAASGARWVRIDLGWSSLQPSGPSSYASWYVERADEVVDAARARGISVLMTLWRTPGWATDGGENAPPSDPRDYGRVARWAANHFAGRVAAWEVWNEPNLNDRKFWTGSPADYAELLEAAYPAFKGGDPSATVVAGSVVYNDDAWLRRMYEAGAQGSFDAISTHPYQGVSDEPPEAPDDGTKWRLSHVSAVHDLMREYGDGDKPIWFTEFGWSSHPNDGDEGNWERGVTAAQQADFAVRAFDFVAERYPYVTHMFWYNERERDTGDAQIDNYGLLHRDLSPKPVYHALASLFAGGSPSQAPTPSPTPAPSPGPTPSPPPTDPLVEIPNGGFEDGLAGWQRASGRVRLVLAGRRGGSGLAMRATRRPAAMVSSWIPVPSGTTLRVAAWWEPRDRDQRIEVVASIRRDRRRTIRSSMTTGARRLRWRQTRATVVTVPTHPDSSELRITLRMSGTMKPVIVDDVLIKAVR